MNKERRYKLIAQNKKARYNYFIEETFQAGVELFGQEVKSLRAGRCNLGDSHVEVRDGQAYLVNMHISVYDHTTVTMDRKDPMRKRRLLLHRREINKLMGAVAKDGYTIVPVKVYFSGPYVKVDIALAKGKKLYDKRASLAAKDVQREHQRDFKIKNL
ncbi:MAG: SsrA-binding protein SmpB [Defluviitaleaceae bacterium]|nr:SsrA-binding protein SmpB [Defluviitaleaceae bacterium]